MSKKRSGDIRNFFNLHRVCTDLGFRQFSNMRHITQFMLRNGTSVLSVPVSEICIPP